MTRSRFDTRGRRALAALGLFVFAAACRRAPPPPAPPPPSVATVDGAPIPLSRLQVEVDRLRQGNAEAPANVDAQDVPKLGRALLDGLIDRALVLSRAKAAGVTVSDAELQKASESLPGVDADEMRDRLLAEKYIASETRREVASPAEARAWYDKHRQKFEEPEAVHCLQISTQSPDQAKSALDQLRKGANFADVAQKTSNSPDAQKGGDLGWFSRGTMPKAFDDACFSLAAGKLSGVIESPYGFHVFKLLAKRPARLRKYEEVRADAVLRATAEKRAEAERALLAQLRQQAQIKVDSSSLALLK
jgi:peptidyl-prolyl cis-trans isomerase C/foldase protein PrsA